MADDDMIDFDVMFLPDKTSLNIDYSDGLYYIKYKEYFKNATEDVINRSVKIMSEQYDLIGLIQPDDEISVMSIVHKDFHDDEDVVVLLIETNNPAIYLYGIAGEYLIQSLAHFKQQKKAGNAPVDTDEFREMMAHNLVDNSLKFFDFPLIFDSDIPEWKKKHEGKK